jgi:hypothetical protein
MRIEQRENTIDEQRQSCANMLLALSAVLSTSWKAALTTFSHLAISDFIRARGLQFLEEALQLLVRQPTCGATAAFRAEWCRQLSAGAQLTPANTGAQAYRFLTRRTSSKSLAQKAVGPPSAVALRDASRLHVSAPWRLRRPPSFSRTHRSLPHLCGGWLDNGRCHVPRRKPALC